MKDTVMKKPFRFLAALIASLFTVAPALALTPAEIASNAELDPQLFINEIENLRVQVNAMLAGMPALEQFEASQELSYGFRCLKSMATNFKEFADALKNKTAGYVQSVKAAAETAAATAAEAKLLASGDYVKKADADAAATSAADKRETEVRETIKTEGEATAAIATQRAKLVTDKVVPSAAVAAGIPDEFFKKEGYDGRVASLKARLKKLTDNKLNSEAFVAEMVSLPLDEAGDKLFDTRLDAVKTMVSGTATRPGPKPSLAAAPEASATSEVEAGEMILV